VHSFAAFARAHGVLIGDLEPGRISRCGTVDHPSSKNGAYFWDGQRGWVMAWDRGGELHWFGESKGWSDEEKRAWIEKRQALREIEEKKWRAAALRATELMRTAVPKEHGYLHRKGLQAVQGLVLPDDTLFVPMRSLRTNELQGAQLIRWLPHEMRWEKKMVAGMRAKGAVLRLGRGYETFLCEGYATGLTIDLGARQLRLNASVLVCFSDSNMVHVASMVRGRAFVFADNDKSQVGEKAAKATGLPYCMSDRVDEDANDLHRRAGLMAVCELLMGVRRGAHGYG